MSNLFPFKIIIFGKLNVNESPSHTIFFNVIEFTSKCFKFSFQMELLETEFFSNMASCYFHQVGKMNESQTVEAVVRITITKEVTVFSPLSAFQCQAVAEE